MVLENKELCKVCKGECCKAMGCHYSPLDFKDLSYEGLKKEIERGDISIDYWEGNPFEDEREILRAYYLRARNINAEIVDASFGGLCSLLTEEGCKFDFNNRPRGGREVIPNENGICEGLYKKKDCAKDWYEYNGVITKLVEEYKIGNDEMEYAIEYFMRMFLNM